MSLRFRMLRLLLAAISMVAISLASAPNTSSNSTVKPAKKNGTVSESASAKKRVARRQHKRTTATTARKRRRRRVELFHTSSFAEDIANGDRFAGEDPMVRQAALDALGNMNGTLVAIDPDSGRILAMVNQKLALSEGAQPCSTIKVAVALAALSEGVIERETPLTLSRYSQMNLTEALAVSNNAYFEAVGRRLGFARVSYYARQFGLGELAGFNIEGEHLGLFPSTELPASRGGVGKMCSFGEGISLTPLQLGALVSAIANGGTLYYLQHPESSEELVNFQPRVKRLLPITNLIPQISDGMVGAVEYGTARSLRTNFSEEQVLGKTGTCSKAGTRFGWFASYANTRFGRVVTVIFLQGGRPTYGPKAAEISGRFYRALYDHNFFTQHAAATSPGERAPATVGVPQ
jgi:penicillin-binding protein 2